MSTIEDALAFAWKLFQARELTRAAVMYRKIVETDPGVAQAWFMLGAVNQLEQNRDLAIASYQRALAIDPNHVMALNNLAVALHSQGKISEAVVCLRRALATKPDYADAHGNLGNAHHEQGQLELAAACYRRALELDPAHFDAHNNLGNVLRAMGHLSESVASYERALSVRPDDPQVRLSRALAWLQMGDFERGWNEYEWRFQCPEFSIPLFRQPVWDGADLDGRTILLYADHGLGDSLQFIRFAALVKERRGRVLVACQQPLARLIATCPGVDQVIPEGAALPAFDVYAPLMSLPRIIRTTPASIPATTPYLSAHPELVVKWRRSLELTPGFKVGIAWQGNPANARDRQRSFRLEKLEPLARVAGVRLLSVQKGWGADQINTLDGRFQVTDLGSRFSDFMDTAAALVNLDVLVTLDSSLAHLGGALGVPTWVALSLVPDWRWPADREDSAWYPTMRLFRQKSWGDWDEVCTRIAAELAKTMAAH